MLVRLRALEGGGSSSGSSDLSDDNPAALGTADPGVDTAASRSDHVHAHGDLAGGSLHANAVSAGAAGFMTGADKAILDGLAGYVGRAVLSNSTPTITRNGSNNVLDTIDPGSAYINVIKFSVSGGAGVISSDANCPTPWMTAGFEGQIVVMKNVGSNTLQINTTAKGGVKLESNTNKTVGLEDIITFIYTNGTWNQMTSVVLLT